MNIMTLGLAAVIVVFIRGVQSILRHEKTMRDSEDDN
jgi:hypothetical protein